MLDKSELIDRPDIAAWIVEAGLADMPVPDLVEGAVQRLRAACVPIDRVNIAFRVLHPLFDGMSVSWTEEGVVAPTFALLGSDGGATDFVHSPFFHMLSNRLVDYRLRLDRDADASRYPIVGQLRAQGHTDYFASIVSFGAAELHPETHDGIATAWSTRDPGGFSDEDLAEIRRTLRALALVIRLAIKDQIMRTALDTFHGPLVGQRILSGAIKRGAGSRIRAALWYSDLRNSTGLADALPTDEFLALLNAYFDCAAGAVMAEGGHVLDIVGDAILAIFPAEDEAGASAACASALAAARAAHARLAVLKGQVDADAEAVSLPGLKSNNPAHAIQFGIGVHFGEVVFGNAGTAERLKFSCHGRAVNEAARMSDMSKRLGRPIIASHAVARRAAHDLDDLGHHDLRGFPVARQLWG